MDPSSIRSIITTLYNESQRNDPNSTFAPVFNHVGTEQSWTMLLSTAVDMHLTPRGLSDIMVTLRQLGLYDTARSNGWLRDVGQAPVQTLPYRDSLASASDPRTLQGGSNAAPGRQEGVASGSNHPSTNAPQNLPDSPDRVIESIEVEGVQQNIVTNPPTASLGRGSPLGTLSSVPQYPSEQMISNISNTHTEMDYSPGRSLVDHLATEIREYSHTSSTRTRTTRGGPSSQVMTKKWVMREPSESPPQKK